MQVIFLFSIFKKPIVNTTIQETWFIHLFNQLNTFFSHLQGSLCNDYCVVNCCGPCVLCQLARELKSLQRWIANQLTSTRNHCFGFLLGLPPSFRASRGFAAPARALLSLNLKKKRDCSQSRQGQAQVAQARNMSIGEHRHCCVTFKI